MTETLNCSIYKSPRFEEMYLYVPGKDQFDDVPEALMTRFGMPVFVMELDLHKERSLAREDVAQVMRNLSEQGFHLQLPPDFKPQLYFGNED